MQKRRIAIIGAGPMGLATAYQLVLDGHQVVVYEADDRVGGMTATFDFNGLEIERYYHFHCTSDRDFLTILDELEIDDQMYWVETKMGYWFQGKLQAWGNPLALLKFDGLSLFAKIRYAVHAFVSVKRGNWYSLDHMKATDWIYRWVGKEAYDVLWDKLLRLKFYDYTDEVSAAWIWSRIRRVGRSRYSIFREKLGYLNGGSKTLLQAMKAAIEAKGGVINLNSPVAKVVINDDKLHGVDIDGRLERFDFVVSTVPLPYVRNLIPDLPEDILIKFKSVKNIAVVCIIVKLSKSVTANFWLNVNDSDMDIPGLVEYTNLYSINEGEHIVYVPFYMPNEHPKFADSDQVFIKKVKSYLKKINPDLEEKDFLDVHASRYRHAQPICNPGYLEQLPSVFLPIEGLCVADTSYYYPEDRGISESIGFGRKMAKDLIT